MGLKKEELSNPNSCLNKAADDEPIFVLRANDALSSQLVRDWARKASALGCGPEKVAEAISLADKMEQWPTRKNPD